MLSKPNPRPNGPRCAEEAERRRKEAAYLAQFGELPPREEEEEPQDESALNAPGAVIPPPENPQELAPAEELPPPVGSNAPVVEQEPQQDLNSIREELRRRGDETQD